MILVTGGCGYIGSHIVDLLSSQGEDVVVYDSLITGKSANLLRNQKLIIGDILDSAKLESVFVDYHPEVVIHLAALVNAAESAARSKDYLAVNLDGSRQVFELAAKYGTKLILFASSAAVYGNPGTKQALTETSPLKPASPYGISKMAAEQVLQDLALRSSLNYGIFRFFNVAGAKSNGQLSQNPANNAILTRLLMNASGQTSSLTISGSNYDTSDGTVVRDFIHVDDIASAFKQAISHYKHGGESYILNLCSKIPLTLKQLASKVEAITGKSLTIQYGPRLKGDVEYSLGDNHCAKEILKWHPQKTIDDIIKDSWTAFHV